MDTACLVCLEASDEEWVCNCCNKCMHWECAGKWWAKGKGCPHCRECSFETLIEKNVGEPITTLHSFMILIIFITLLSSTGNNEKLSHILELD